jgi:hypothetical protein
MVRSLCAGLGGRFGCPHFETAAPKQEGRPVVGQLVGVRAKHYTAICFGLTRGFDAGCEYYVYVSGLTWGLHVELTNNVGLCAVGFKCFSLM